MKTILLFLLAASLFAGESPKSADSMNDLNRFNEIKLTPVPYGEVDPLWTALTTRVITDNEMAEVLRRGWSIACANLVQFRESDKQEEFLYGLKLQQHLREVAATEKQNSSLPTVDKMIAEGFVITGPIHTDSSVKIPGKAVVTKAEVEEVVKALTILFRETDTVATIKHFEAGPDYAGRFAFMKQREEDLAWSKNVLTKWQTKLDAMK